jgi:methionyl-tRNA formyltransferase
VVEVTKTTMKIQTGSGLLSVRELQPEGKKRMEIDAFLRGYPVTAGESF